MFFNMPNATVVAKTAKYMSFCLYVIPTLGWRIEGDERAKDYA
jgi:hypothetical protein